jgi:hypothetical protein
MHINITDNNDTVHPVVCEPELSINGRMITSMEEAIEEIDRVISVKNNESSAWHFCPLFFRTSTSMVAFDARNIKSYEIIPDIQE